MSNSQTAILPSRALIAISGEEARHFLHNLVTCDVENLNDGSATFGALLTPQGKVLFDFHLFAEGDGFVLDVEADERDALAKRLMFYRLRAKVEIGPDERGLAVEWPSDTAPLDGRLAGLGRRRLTMPDEVTTTATEQEWHAHRFALGVPQSGQDFALGDVFPHEVLMDQFSGGGVDFAKGCYVGQEVVSRMQHRGTARSRFVIVEAASGELPAMGTPVTAGDRTIGSMGSHAGQTGLALIRLDRASAALREGKPLMAADAIITPRLPDFVSFDWPS